MNGKQQKIEDILNSLDGVKPASAPDFFYTRLHARMVTQHKAANSPRPWFLRPAFAFVAFAIFIGINVAVLLTNNYATDNNNLADNADNLQNIAAEFNTGDTNNSIYDLAIEK